MHRHGSMNHIFRLIWSHVLNGWVAVAETTRGRGKGALRKLVAAALALNAVMALAAPDGGQVVSGSGTIAQSGATTTINQASQNLSLTWQHFNVGTNETVNFVQPSASAIAVNRIFDTNGSSILGRLNANGQVYLINPNGILFGQGAQVNVGSLVASTLEFNDASLTSNTRNFSGNGSGSIVNHGSINAANGGYVALLANHVSNQGTITAPQGTVALGAGSSTTLTFQNNSLVSMQVDQSVLNSLTENGGLIQANGGMVMMSAGAKDALLASVVNNTGVIEAQTVDNHNGTIMLLGGMAAGTVNVGGTLDASAPNGGNGGFIETSAANVKIADNVKITTAAAMGVNGTWLIDPVDFTIAATGGNMTGAALTTSLGSGNVVIQSSSGSSGTAGDVNVNDVVSWSANKLTLNAQNNINIRANMNASAAASLALEFGQGAVAAANTSNIVTTGASVNLPASTTNFTTKQGSNGAVKNYTVITSLGAAGSTTATDLQGMNGNKALNYALGTNVDASATSGWNAGAGFTPIGTYLESAPANFANTFNGTFDGLGHTISNLATNQTRLYVGFIGVAGSSSAVRNVGMVGGSVTNNTWGNGALIGYNFGAVSNSYATGSVTGYQAVGGLVGSNKGTITDSYASGTVSATGNGEAGGLVGWNFTTISNSHATGNVSSVTNTAGGLAGGSGGTITNGYATGNVNGMHLIGGLVGNNGGGTISASQASGNVGGVNQIGGLVGNNGGIINASQASGSVTSTGEAAGGLVGSNSNQINNSYSTGSVTGTRYTGGLVGSSSGTTNNSHYDMHTVTINGTVDTYLTEGALYSPQYQDWFSHSLTLNIANYSASLAGSGTNYTVNSVQGLKDMLGFTDNAALTFTQTANIDLTGQTNLHIPYIQAKFNGAGYTISNLNVAQSFSDAGMFGIVGGSSTVSNVNLVNATVAGGYNAGGLAGRNLGSIVDSSVTGTVSGTILVGGLAGYSYGTITNSRSSAGVSGTERVGGLVGVSNGTIANSHASGSVTGTGDSIGGLVGQTGNGNISNSHATGAVSGSNKVGGLVGEMRYGTLSNSYSTGSVSGNNQVGGLVGWFQYGAVSNSYATGAVTGNNDVGGLAGYDYRGNVSNSYATGAVSGNNSVGGLVGNSYYGSIDTSYSSGAVTGNADVGGLVGYDYGGSFNNSFWNKTTSGQTGSAGGLGLTSVEMQNMANFAGFNFTTAAGAAGNNWVMVDTYGTLNNAGGALGATLPMLASEYSTTINNAHELQLMAMARSASYTLGGNIDAAKTGTGTDVWGSGGFVPVGNYLTKFTGTFDGLNHTISNLMINTPAQNNVGLFGATASGAVISNVGLLAVDMHGQWGVGALVGTNESPATIDNSYSTGSVNGVVRVGGLAGSSYGTVTNSHSSATVTGDTYVGGLVGRNYIYSGSFSNNYATGNVTGNNGVGGLVGSNEHSSTISNSYATGNVISTGDGAGGLVGQNDNSSTLSNSYSTGNVTGATGFGGLVGKNDGTLSNSHYDLHNVTINGVVDTYVTSGALYTVQYQDWFSHSKTLNIANYSASLAGSGNNYTLNSVQGFKDLLGFADNSAYTFTQTGNIDLNGQTNLHIPYLAASFNGGGYTISNLSLSQPQNQLGLFGLVASGSTVSNVNLLSIAVDGIGETGGLAGRNNGTISNSTATGSVSGTYYGVGGLTGFNYGTISNSSSAVNVTGTGSDVGGLVGTNQGTMSGSHATGNVSGNTHIGGLAGQNHGAISNSYATIGTVNGTGSAVGGLVGWNNYGSISNSYASTAVVSASDRVGGLVGHSYGVSATISNSYASGSVTGANIVGGLVGHNDYGSTVSNSYATGAVSVTGGATVGGLIGHNSSGSVINSFWDATSTGQASSEGGVGMTTAQMQTQANFTSATLANGSVNPAWDFGSTWVMYDGHTSPLLRTFMTALTVTASDASKTYDGLAYSGGNGVTYSTAPNGNLLGTVSYGGTSQGATNAGSYGVTASGLYSNQQGYLISYADGALTVNKANLTLGGTRAYDGTGTMAGSVLTASGVHGETFTVTGAGNAGNVASKNVQSGSTLASLTGLSLGTSGNGGLSTNYNAMSATGSSVSISKADLTIATSAVTKTYDGTLAASGTATATSGTLFGSDSLSGGTFAYTNANAGTSNKTVTTSAVTVNDGNGGGNYNISYANNITSTINKANLTLSTVDVSRTYDGSLTASGTATVTGGTLYTNASNSNTLDSISGGTYAFTNANAGTGNKAVSAAAVTVNDGNSGGNYNVSYANNITSTINKANLTISTTDVSKTYDALLSAAGTATVTSGTLYNNASNGGTQDSISGGAFAYTSKNVGGGNKTVTTSGVTVVDGNSGNNYNVSYANNTTSTIAAANLAVTGVTAHNKPYDGTTLATLGGTAVVTALGTDSVTVGCTGSGVFADSNVGTAKGVTVTGFTLGGTDAGNYNVVQPTGVTADITVAAATVAPTPVLNVTTQLLANMLSQPASGQSTALDLSSTITVTERASADGDTTVAQGDGASSGNAPVPNVSMNIGSNGPALQIISGGVKLPDNMLNEEDKRRR